MDQPGKEKSMGINESVFEKRQTLTKDPNQNQPRQPKPDQHDEHQRYLEELAGKGTAGMGDTLGMMGSQSMGGPTSGGEQPSFDLPPEKQKYSQQAAGQGDQFPMDVSAPPEITPKGNEPEQKAHKQKYSVERHLPKPMEEYKATYTSQTPGQGTQQPLDMSQPPQISDKGAQDQQKQFKETYSVNPSDQQSMQQQQMPEGGLPIFETDQQRREDEQLAQQTKTGLSLQSQNINASEDLGLGAEATEVLSKTSNFELSDSDIPHTRRIEQTDPEYSTQDLPDLGPDDSECDLGTRPAGAKNAFVHFLPTEPETAEEAVEPPVDRGDLQPDENVCHPEDFLTPPEKHEDQCQKQQTQMPQGLQQTQLSQGRIQQGQISKDLHAPSVEQELCIPDDVVNVLAEPSHFENRESHTRRLEETDPSYQTSDIPDIGPDDTECDLGSRPTGAKNAFIHFMPEAPETASEAVDPQPSRGDLQPDDNVNQPEDFLTPQDKGQGIQQQGMSAQQQGPGFISAGQEVNITGGQGTQLPIHGSQRAQMGRCRVSFDPLVKAIEYHHNDSDLPESERSNLPPTPVSGFPMTEMDLKAGKIKHAICKVPQRPILLDSEEQVLLGVKTGLPKLEVLDLAMEMTDLIPFSDRIRTGVHTVEDTYDYVKDTSPAPVRWGISLAERMVKNWIRSTSYVLRPFRFPIRLLDRLSIGIIDACLPAAA